MKGIPLFYGKPSDKAIFTPKDKIEYKKKIGFIKDLDIPKNIIITFSRNYLKILKRKYKTKKMRWISGLYHLLTFKVGNKRMGVSNHFGVGASMTASVLEELIAGGVKNFIVLGLTGSIQNDFRVGDIGLIERAIRDEGTSYHYLAPSKYSYSNKKFNRIIENFFKLKKIKYRKGTVWSTDATYRQTIKELIKYRKEDVLGVEMEAAAMFAIAKYKKVNLGLLVVVTDTLNEKGRVAKFHTKKVFQSQEKIFNVAIEILKSIGN